VCQHCTITLLLLLLLLLQTMPYRLNEETGIIDYDMLEKTAKLFRPKLIVAGATCKIIYEVQCVGYRLCVTLGSGCWHSCAACCSRSHAVQAQAQFVRCGRLCGLRREGVPKVLT
jgi:hypothetical protein